MRTLEDELREALRGQARALRVPERPTLDHDGAARRRHPASRWLVAAACLALIAAAVVAAGARRVVEIEPPASPVASVAPETTTSAVTAASAGSVVPQTTTPAVPVSSAHEPPTAEPAVTELLTGFLQARLSGDGAQQYLNVPEDDIPLLYSASSGSPYTRAEFERVPGIDWPYGWTAFTLRLFADDVVVEQLFFTTESGRSKLEYQPDGFGTAIAPTTEDGQPLVVRHDVFGGGVTLRVAHPWIFSDGAPYGRLIPNDPDVAATTDGGERNDWDEIFLMADPVSVGADCRPNPSPTDVEALAESLRSEPGVGATAPVAVRIRGAEALMMDLVIPAGQTICVPEIGWGGLLSPVFARDAPFSVNDGVTRGVATGEPMRLYLFDAPEESSMRILAVAIVAPASRLESTAQAAAPIVRSVEFRGP
jgi:hypothetical protein